MAVVSSRSVRQALRGRILNIDGIVPRARWAFENRTSKVPATSDGQTKEDGLWIEEACAITAEERLSIRELRVFGRARYWISTPTGKGTEEAEDMALLLTTSLQTAAYIQDQGVTLYIDRAERLPPFIKEGWWVMPVEIAWRAHTHETQQAT